MQTKSEKKTIASIKRKEGRWKKISWLFGLKPAGLSKHFKHKYKHIICVLDGGRGCDQKIMVPYCV